MDGRCLGISILAVYLLAIIGPACLCYFCCVQATHLVSWWIRLNHRRRREKKTREYERTCVCQHVVWRRSDRFSTFFRSYWIKLNFKFIAKQKQTSIQVQLMALKIFMWAWERVWNWKWILREPFMIHSLIKLHLLSVYISIFYYKFRQFMCGSWWTKHFICFHHYDAKCVSVSNISKYRIVDFYYSCSSQIDFADNWS